MNRYNLETVSTETKSPDSIDDISMHGCYVKDRLFKASKFKDNIHYASENWGNWFHIESDLSLMSIGECKNHSLNDNYYFTTYSCIIEKELDGDISRHCYHHHDVFSFKSLSRRFNNIKNIRSDLIKLKI